MEYSLKNSVLGAALFAGVAFGVNANAGQSFSGFEPSGDGWEAAFSNNKLALTGNHFADDYTFSLPAAIQGGGASVISNLTRFNSLNVGFTNFSLYDDTTSTLIGGGSTSGPISFFTFGPISTPTDTFRLHVEGNVLNVLQPSGYAGNLSVSAVPEPETYAMLLAGLGLIGFSARRRVAAV